MIEDGAFGPEVPAAMRVPLKGYLELASFFVAVKNLNSLYHLELELISLLLIFDKGFK